MKSISAQVSLYPLRRESLAPAIDKALRILREHNLRVEPGIMSTLILGEEETVFAALQETFHHLANQGQLVMVATFSNACPAPASKENSITYTAIGYVENEFNEPTAPDKLRAAESRIVLNPNLAEGLKGLSPRQNVLVLFHFHLAQDYDLLQHPRGDDRQPKRGVFTLRSPNRPNTIGICEVECIAMEENVLRVKGLDALNGTPILDLKPV